MKLSNGVFFLALLAVFLFSAMSPVAAAKKRVWGKTIVKPSGGSANFSVSAKFTGWKQYLNVSFRGVANTKGVSYELIYASKGVDQGAGGSVNPSEGNVSRSMFLGTCSHGVCVAHKNISNVRLKVTYTTSDGVSKTKSYKVRY